MSPSPASSVGGSSTPTTPRELATTTTARPSVAIRQCTFPHCHNKVRSKGLCKAHGGGLRCMAQGCTRSSQGKGYCIRHGGGKRCSMAGCSRSSQSNGFCKSHGGGLRCQEPNCNKSSQGGGYCRLHGGGHRCQHDQCDKSAQRGGYCSTHGGNRACKFPDCTKNDRGGGYCAEHGGGRRCTFESCNKPAREQGMCSHHAAAMSGGALILAPPTMLPSPMTATNMGSLDVSFGQTLAYHHTMYPPVSQDPHTRNFPRSVSFNSYFHDVVSTDASMPRGFSGSDVVHEYFTKAESAPPYPHHDHQQHHMATMASHAAHQASLSSGYRFGVPPYAFSSPLPVPPSASANMYTVPSSGGPSNHPSYHHQSLPHDEIAMHPSSFLPDPLPYPYPEQCTTGSPSMLYHPPLARLPHSHHTDGLAATHQAGTGIFSPPRRDLP